MSWIFSDTIPLFSPTNEVELVSVPKHAFYYWIQSRVYTKNQRNTLMANIVYNAQQFVGAHESMAKCRYSDQLYVNTACLLGIWFIFIFQLISEE